MPAPKNNFEHAANYPLFAQSLEAQRLRQLPPEDDKFSFANLAVFSLPVVMCGLFLVAARPDKAQSAKPQPRSGKMILAQAAVADKGPVVEPPDGSAGERRPLSFYTQGVRGSLFSAPIPPAPVVKTPVVKVDKPKPIAVVPIATPEINPFADWSYTGTIKAGEQTMALVENTKTKEGQYIRPGERFLGATVMTVTDQSIALSAAGSKSYSLAKSDNINVTPLDKNAPYLSGGGGQPGMPQPGMPQPGMPQGMPTMSMPGNMGQVILPNGRAMTPDQAQRRADFMNRRFNGGGGGRGGRGGF